MSTDKVTAVEEKDICEAIKAHEVYSRLAEKISNRMNYIIRFCINTVGGKFEWWDWPNDGEGDDKAPGDFMRGFDKDNLTITGEWTKGDKTVFIDKNGDEYELGYNVPSRWLYEDFEQEYVDGLKTYAQKQKEKAERDKANRDKKKQEQAALVKSAKSKLTAQERKVLGL